MSSTPSAVVRAPSPESRSGVVRRIFDLLSMPVLAVVTALVLGAIVIWLTSQDLETVAKAYEGLLRGAFIKQRSFSESLLATIPYIFLSLAVALGFKSGVFNIGVEGQFYVGAVSAVFVGQLFQGLPAIVHLPLALLAGALGGAIWGAIPGFLKARFGAHEVINTIMMNYIAFRLIEFLVSGPLRNRGATAVQTARISPAAELWLFNSIPQRLQDPLNALLLALVFGLAAWLISRALAPRRSLIIALITTVVTFVALPLLTRVWWPFVDKSDRLHIGLILALVTAVGVWWLLWKTTIGFELRTAGANPTAARYAGISITRNMVLAMALSGALAGVAGTIEVLGVSICRCLPLFFSSGYGFESIAIALLGKNNPFGIVLASFLFGAMRNGADLMELNSGVSKDIISLVQALVLLFVASPAIVRWIYRLRAARRPEEEAPLTRGWGG